MPRVIFILPDGSQREVDAPVGDSVMHAAYDNGVPGILAECGGCLTCATCHGYIDPDWSGKLEPPTPEERIMIDCALDVRPESRLTCQVKLTAVLDGLVVHVPQTQT